MNDLFGFSLLSFTSFFTLINSLANIPIFMTMTANIDQEHRIRRARKASIVVFITIVIFAFSGQLLFNFFGISVHSFRIVGGVIFFLMGLIVMVIAVEFFFSGLKPIVMGDDGVIIA